MNLAELQLNDAQIDVLADFLDKDDCKKVLVEWLEEAGLSTSKAKLLANVGLYVLPKLAKGAGRLGGKVIASTARWTHEKLTKHFVLYEQATEFLLKTVFRKLQKHVTRKAVRKALLQIPTGFNKEEWKRLDDTTQHWFLEFEKLEAIQLALGELGANIHLRIPKPRPKIRRLSELLHAHNEFIGLTGRDRELQKLSAFCRDAAPFGWRVVYGDGGLGKTRLALELAKKHKEEGWDAGFMDGDVLGRFVRHVGFDAWQPLNDTLIVVDYAASKVEDLKKLVTHCARYALSVEEEGETAPRVCLLLLERHAEEAHGWLEDLRGSGEKDVCDWVGEAYKGAVELYAPRTEDMGHPHASSEQILKDTFAAWDGYQESKGEAKPAPEFPEFEPSDWQQIQRNTENRPLYLQMAALHACDTGEAKDMPTWTRGKLLKEAVQRERDYVRSECPDNKNLRELVEWMAALLCLTGSSVRRRSDWNKILGEEIKNSPWPATQPGEVDDTLSAIFSGSTGDREKPIQPDILAAAFAATVFKRDGRQVTEGLRRALEIAGANAWPNLLRLVQDLYLIDSLEGVENWLTPLIEGREFRELWVTENALPHRTISLDPFAVVLDETLLRRLSADTKVDPERARLYSNLGARLGYLGQRDSALSATERAAEIRERLAERNPAEYLPDLAVSLGNLGSVQNALGRHEAALSSTERSVEIRERLAEQKTDASLFALAISLNNLGNALSELGRHKEACNVAERSLELCETLVERNPDKYLPFLAASLNNMGNGLIALDRYEEALQAVERAVKLHEALAEVNPDAYLPDIAMSLNSLGPILSVLGRHKEALKAAERAVEIREQLAERTPDAYLPNLATSLRNFGERLSDLGRYEAASSALERAVEIRERLAEADPDAFLPGFARSLGTLGQTLARAGELERAREKFLLGIKTLHPCFESLPQAHAQTMAQLLADCMGACQATETEPDEELLRPIFEKLAELGLIEIQPPEPE